MNKMSSEILFATILCSLGEIYILKCLKMLGTMTHGTHSADTTHVCKITKFINLNYASSTELQKFPYSALIVFLIAKCSLDEFLIGVRENELFVGRLLVIGWFLVKLTSRVHKQELKFLLTKGHNYPDSLCCYKIQHIKQTSNDDLLSISKKNAFLNFVNLGANFEM